MFFEYVSICVSNGVKWWQLYEMVNIHEITVNAEAMRI